MGTITTINRARTHAQVHAYDYFGPLHASHVALQAGLLADSDDADLRAVSVRIRQGLGDSGPFVLDGTEVILLEAALASWREDLVELGRLAQ